MPRFWGLIAFAAMLVPIAAIIYMSGKGISFWRALAACTAWAGAIIVLMLINWAIGDMLNLGRESSGYAHGRKVISPYAFVVQLLLIVEIAGLVWLKKYMAKREKKDGQGS